MDTLRALFIKKPLINLGSTVIRLALPHTLFHLAQCSHSIIVDGEYAIEATMCWLDGRKVCSGVRRVPLSAALAGSTVAQERQYTVPDVEKGLAWARSQVGKPYDFKGAIGLAIAPERDWQQDDMWFCHELTGRAIHECGRIAFGNVSHLTSRELLGIAA